MNGKLRFTAEKNEEDGFKLHIGVDPKTQELIAIEVTDEITADCAVLPSLIAKAPKSLKKVYADGAYDRKNCREILSKSGIEECIPPRKNGKIWNESGLEASSDALKIIRAFGNGDFQRSCRLN